MEKSEYINELAVALANAQGEFQNPKKNKTNPFLHNKYADIASIIDAVREPLAKNGLSIIQTPTINEDMVTVSTMILHASGQYFESSLSMQGENKGKGGERKPMDIQAFAGTISYIRRYALQTILCIAADDDDDGETGREFSQQRPVERKERKNSEQNPFLRMYAMIETLWNKYNLSPHECLQSCKKHLGVDSLRDCHDLDTLNAYYTYKQKQLEISPKYTQALHYTTFLISCEIFPPEKADILTEMFTNGYYTSENNGGKRYPITEKTFEIAYTRCHEMLIDRLQDDELQQIEAAIIQQDTDALTKWQKHIIHHFNDHPLKKTNGEKLQDIAEMGSEEDRMIAETALTDEDYITFNATYTRVMTEAHAV